MSQSQRLFEILQILRRHRQAVTGNYLAQETGVSLRTIYRDIILLQSIGAEIEGEPGFGYVLRPGFMLPPLMFSQEEIKAIALGVQWVSRQADEVLHSAAQDALAKIEAVLPLELRHKLNDNDFHISRPSLAAPVIDLKILRQAMQQQMKLRIVYRDAKDADSERVIWPIAVAFFDSRRIIAGWCELRGDFRIFRADRIQRAELLADRYPGQRRELVKQWRAQVAETAMKTEAP
ncbi:YafY family transcriptional regulator [Agrobacterium rhizogenes]|uniref:helix-turn-helix transcriptional regulator n=1 Tax=Rhizobium rhizogenes TaxID=359 RepID=UPI0004DA8302|nr:YafY family protein [Rhizobium rhizogenes]KAA6487751.1 YafY family transcriptional regulator [Agrobacterium sp. ICMP 7243]OCI96175.1 DNA-binding protein [Agrobacterium sp. 13-626]OCJ09863.1 DNA-binding protein [Agrobacterium sp. B131/95]OCJ23008.1 DNA-binding protein [Agrobacterium sp. B133/95]KEA08201.1 DNA-binding protein [Rhizobium rhizogenes]